MPRRPRPTQSPARRRPWHLERLEDRTAPAVAVWDGGGADDHWTTPANWVGDVAPQPGDDLQFPAGAAQLFNTNDFPAGTAFGSLSLTGAGYHIGGNALTLAAGVTADIPAGGAVSEFDLPIGGAGGLVKNGAGTLSLVGDNSYTGPTAVNAGVLETFTGTALGATGAGNGTAVSDGATLELFGLSSAVTIAEAITFSGQGVSGLGSGLSGALIGSVTLSGPLTMTGDARIGTTGGVLAISRGIDEAGGSHSLSLAGGGANTGEVRFTATAVNTYTGTTTVAGNVRIDGRSPTPVVVAGGILEGNGTVGPVQATAGRVSPGTTDSLGNDAPRPAVLTVGGLDLQSAVTTHIALSPGGFDRFVVHGGVRLAGQLDLLFYLANPLTDFPIRPGQSFTLIDNDGTDPVQGTFQNWPEGTLYPFRPVPVRISYHGGDGNDVVLTGVSTAATAVGAGPGGVPLVNVYDGAGGLVRSFLAYDPAFRGGVRVATADLDGDGIPDIITAPGPGGGPHVRVFDGQTGQQLPGPIGSFMAYDPNFTGGVSISTADINGNGTPDIITGAGPGGGPHVKVFSGDGGGLMASFLAFDPAFTGGVSVAGLPGTPGIHGLFFVPGLVIVGAGPGGGPVVRTFSGGSVSAGSPPLIPYTLATQFFAYDPAFRGGVNVAAGTLATTASNVFGSVVTAPASAGGPDVRIYDISGGLRAAFLAYDPTFLGGVTVAVPPQEVGTIVTGTGPGGGPHVKEWMFPGGAATLGFFAFDPAFTGGVFVG